MVDILDKGCYTMFLHERSDTMSKRYTHNYLAQWEHGLHGDSDSTEFYTEQFETEAAEYLRGCDSDNVGGVVLYLRGGDEVAFFDYENLVGSIYELGGRRSDEI